jgi:alcohol dehydrogenase
MKAHANSGPAKKDQNERPKPEITAPTAAIVKITKTTFCVTDLLILKGEVQVCQPWRRPALPSLGGNSGDES